jgi:outer membrane protein assembly factor BamE (lipoprotein component of BamABCDE complex)
MTTRRSPKRLSGARFSGLLVCALPLLLCAATTGCVTVDAETNEVIPRGDQRYKFETVKKYAENLETGMTKLQVLATVGSPAEKSEKGDRWVYLPERPAVLIPSKALRLMFVDNRLTEFGYHAIVLGQQL